MNSSKMLKILFVTPEAVPFIKTGGVADVSGSLPLKLQELGHQVRIVIPKYALIDERRHKIHEVVRLKEEYEEVNRKKVMFSFRSSFLVATKTRVQIYFLDNQDYFANRKGIYTDPKNGKPYLDNDERFILLTKSVFALILKLGWVPDIIHCNDWQSALIPIYLKSVYKDVPELKNIKTLLTIHNFENQGVFPAETFAKTELPKELKTDKGLSFDGKINFLKGGLLYSDLVNTVSGNYVNELCSDPDVSFGLKNVLCKRRDDFYGILNGIDTVVWNPEKDKRIPKKYSVKNFEDKRINKKALCEKFNFQYDENIPIISIISRLTESKGIDFLMKDFNELLKLKANFILLGDGELKYKKFFEEKTKKSNHKFACQIGFDENLAHLVQAGSDMILIPSKYEPCGLNQMYGLMYGTIPIVRKTGGLADTIKNFDEKDFSGNGFVYEKFSISDMIKTINRAITLYSDRTLWEKLAKSGMKSNFSWTNSTGLYLDLYRKLVG
ncbi:MAG: glycogen synthase GlgA [Ignavibacteriales bacterium]|nr:glycogen synthase GlgA [Ignavibacteriales bacterium]